VDSYRCISLDQRGHGQTDQPPIGYDWHTLSTDIIEACYQLGVQEAAVMGHSWGGYVALSLAAKYPKRVSKLVMVDGGFMDWTRWPGATWEWFTNLLKPRDVSGTREEFLDHLRQQLAECWSDQLEEIVMSMVRVGPDGLVRDILEPTNHAQVLDALWNEPPSTMFSQVHCPTLIVPAGPRQGQEDTEFSRMRREMTEAAHAAIRDSRVEWIPETMHDIGYHKPQELAQTLLAFLSDESH
jgi:pimeloyl-ACP methyl ester carboxylesterase